MVAELDEKDFIQEKYRNNPSLLWYWLFLLLAMLILIWAGSKWYQSKMDAFMHSSPFLQVTNRQLSLFLWQNPEFMRINAKERSNYLTGFQYIDKVTADIATADDYAVVPPEVLFRYHTWDRLIRSEFSPTPIPSAEFVNFLSYDEQWLPEYWPKAPPDYVSLVLNLPHIDVEDLSDQPLTSLPQDVRIAFQGWKNYFIDGEEINRFNPTLKLVRLFLKDHPHFARNYWRNVVIEHTPDYLISVTQHDSDPEAIAKKNELTGFLRVALFNYLTTQKPSSKTGPALPIGNVPAKKS